MVSFRVCQEWTRSTGDLRPPLAYEDVPRSPEEGSGLSEARYPWENVSSYSFDTCATGRDNACPTRRMAVR